MKKSRVIKVDYLARVEGEGGLYVKITGDQVTDVKLNIFEPPRFFEAMLRGRDGTEAPDITARICGICPVAYQMSAVHAVEQVLGITMAGQLRALRRLIYCGEWIESHALHVYMLHAPDFLGYDDAIKLARDHPEVVERGLQIKKAGNQLLALVGGRAVHPVNVRVGGFYRAPARAELLALTDRLKWGRDAARATVQWVSGFNFPEFEQDYEFVTLHHPDEYPFNEGNIVSNRGLDISAREFEDHFTEEQVEHSTALHCRLKARGAYLVGPLARYNINKELLAPGARAAARDAGLDAECRNPFKSIIVRAVELVHAFEEALRIIDEYQEPSAPSVAFEPCAGVGHGCTEAPRGILYHRYNIDEQGKIEEAKIVPPTSQNQRMIEADLRGFVSNRVGLERNQLTWQCEQMIRNYDPCISCSTHFLKLEIERV